MVNATGKRKVVIVGGGVAGIAAFVSAVSNRSVSRIDIVDPRGIGNGIAFATTDPALLCNTSVETMSLLADDPDDFLRYLRAQAITVSPDAFVPRFHVSRYLADRYAHYRMLARDVGVGHRHLRATARTIEKQPTGGYRVLLDDGTSLEASEVLICTGSGAPFLPDALRSHTGAPALFECLYPERRVIEYLATPSRVLVVGSRLSAVDAALLACGAGHSVVMASPSGRLPAVRTATPRQCPVAIDEAAFARLDLSSPLLYRRLLRQVARSAEAVAGRPLRTQIDRSTYAPERLAREAGLARRGATDWQNLLVRYMDLAEQLLRAGTPGARTLALANCATAVGRYLFALPLETAEKLLSYMNEGRLQVMPAVPERLRRDELWRVQWSSGTLDSFDAVICATGFQKQRFHATYDSLELTGDPLLPVTAPRVSQDLRVWLPEASEPERIWTAGIASYLAAPMVNAVYQSVRQASEITGAWRSS
ncbi:FAD/NAD(P)-binding protein [Paraburkholderia sartisoli]|uniref:Uncharacterized NAD(P)/FAD-binding protein YdhS n=1 Tax=Paraburkholderia sartisoli TaxID=83784 RepID=A0A1H4D4B2_9BURK|nr:FAD/NAD(P)-binding protein [Paraburkholderia sartisoli]SEA67269.1 Uncharacterized NAD(P)/FAD-binding protein YdhS [Paraburkholderia sartisoli]